MKAEPRLTSSLAAAFARCAERCPSFAQHLGDFAAALGDRFTSGDETERSEQAERVAGPEGRRACWGMSLPNHAAPDLFVAWATARAIPEAVAQFDRDYLTPAGESIVDSDS